MLGSRFKDYRLRANMTQKEVAEMAGLSVLTQGYLPNKEHCLMIGGKLQNITREDAILFARENGIRRPDAIIRDVVASLKQFRTIAMKYGVSEQWTGRVEATIISHLKSWGELT